MKKKLIAALLALAVLLGCVTVGWAGAQTDPLVSLSYLTGTYLTDLKAYITQWVTQNTQIFYVEALEKAGQGTPSADGWVTSDGFAAGQGKSGDTITLTAGSGLIWTSGSGAVGSGVLMDATAGAELAPGGALTAGHRYLAGADTVVVSTSQSAQWMAEGKWRLGAGGTVDAPLPFTDVNPGDDFYDAVKWNYNNNFIKGTTATTFRPYNTITRAQLVTILYRNAGSPAVDESDTPYTDINVSTVNAEMRRAIVWATRNGIVEGYGGGMAGMFGPGNSVRNQELAKILYSFNVLRGGSTAGTADLGAVFTDSGEIAAWAVPYVQWAVANGVMGAYDTTCFRPQVTPMRGRVAMNIYNYGTRFPT